MESWKWAREETIGVGAVEVGDKNSWDNAYDKGCGVCGFKLTQPTIRVAQRKPGQPPGILTRYTRLLDLRRNIKEENIFRNYKQEFILGLPEGERWAFNRTTLQKHYLIHHPLLVLPIPPPFSFFPPPSLLLLSLDPTCDLLRGQLKNGQVMIRDCHHAYFLSVTATAPIQPTVFHQLQDLWLHRLGWGVEMKAVQRISSHQKASNRHNIDELHVTSSRHSVASLPRLRRARTYALCSSTCSERWHEWQSRPQH